VKEGGGGVSYDPCSSSSLPGADVPIVVRGGPPFVRGVAGEDTCLPPRSCEELLES